ncbi:Lon protease C-terminal proteolytic domain-containing protein [Cantharellus anzutake]|uniref:Lon protease C-terminal proteolytic domain-containing protein n=1 Tax=Cantharellus anzutake TaxID=1750568 RepID=UPI0019042E4D|nr:Lon protease C-terminal proteolytic domain-containing protein [Cantharellus anzutake]KAF8340332.1 Lon protease C-terminal proteolytic domain-containing protein [Cantharellus anzutake]
MNTLLRLVRWSTQHTRLGSAVPTPLTVFCFSRTVHRCFHTSGSFSYPRPSRPLRYPRSANGSGSRGSGRETGAPKEPGRVDEATEAESTGENSVSASKPDDNGDRGSPPRSSSSSSSSDEPPDDGKPPAKSPPPESDSPPPSTSISKQSVPESYPQVLALPITRRPLFPGFYKAVVVKHPAVVAAIKEMMKRGQPYIGAFLLKDENADSDIITDLSGVHRTGVFAQITSVFPASSPSNGRDEEKDDSLTVVLYPHRRIHINELLPIRTETDPVPSETATGGADVTGPDQKDPQSLNTEPRELLPNPDGTSADLKNFVAPIHTSFLHDFSVSIVNVDNLTAQPFNKSNQYIRAVMSEIVSVFKDIAQLNPLFRDQITNFTISQSANNVFDEPDKLADFAAAVSTGEVEELQDVLESLVIEDRLRKALLVLKKELINAQLQSKISRDVESKIQKRQREYYLMEQLKGIKKELGMESDGKDKLIEKFKERADSLKMPEGVRKVFEEELAKLQHLEPAASEANVTRNYLDWLTQIPWGVHSPENFSISHAVKVLDEDHYGLTDIKDRILEFLAVGKLRGSVEGKIICFVGPPGVGKTSIGKSIARALNRQFFRFSVGGLTDVAEIKGHRRTYVGYKLIALPSKIIQALKRVGTENPLILIDEVDKIGRGINGDPSSALLEMLDPEQNSAFLDHYMDVPVDLSRVLFVCTANNLDTIPAPLLDRMEVLQVSGYVSEEKSVIAERYLAPQARAASGLKDVDVTLSADAINILIQYYCRESGVRNLKKHIDKVYRKAALKIVRDLGDPENDTDSTAETELSAPPSPSAEVSPTVLKPGTDSDADAASDTPGANATATQEPDKKVVTTQEGKPMAVPDTVHLQITPDNLKDYVGPPIYQKDRFYTRAPPAGVSTGLGYLGNGSGSVMPVEASAMPGKGVLQLTGKLGEVIRESAQIGLSWVKTHAFELGITPSPTEPTLKDQDIHLHMPEGSIGKEGPSAGTAIITAYVSLLTKTPVNPDIAMTGEVSLVGQVLPVGGLKEKILAAHRAGIKTIIAPGANRADIEENVPASVKTGIRFVYVEDIRHVLHEVFNGHPVQERWKDTMPYESGDPIPIQPTITPPPSPQTPSPQALSSDRLPISLRCT